MAVKPTHLLAGLPPEKLRWSCDPATIPFETTAQAELVTDLVGQERAFRALKMGVELSAPGYNIFVCGLAGTSRGGTITHVIGGVNPQGVLISTFKQPTPEERRHGFLWRIRKRLPERGQIGIFNRSHYEDVIIARVHDLAKPPVIERRYGIINAFEKELVKRGTKIVKLCLHISYDEQRRRLLDRLRDPDKHWKFKENDIDERAFWDDYQSAYSIAITQCSTQWAPWYVVPANDKDYRNWAVSRLLIEVLDEMDPQYPRPKLNVPRLTKRLQA